MISESVRFHHVGGFTWLAFSVETFDLTEISFLLLQNTYENLISTFLLKFSILWNSLSRNSNIPTFDKVLLETVSKKTTFIFSSLRLQMISAFTFLSYIFISEMKELNGYLEYQNIENSSFRFCMENSQGILQPCVLQHRAANKFSKTKCCRCSVWKLDLRRFLIQCSFNFPRLKEY